MVTVQVLGHLKMIDPAQIQSKPLHLCGECPSHHLGWEVDQEILSLTLNIALGLRPRAIFQVRERISRSLPPFMKGRLQSDDDININIKIILISNIVLMDDHLSAI